MSRNCLLAATFLAGAMALPHLAAAQPISGVYIGAGAGANFMQQQQFRQSPLVGPNRFGHSGSDTGVAGVGSVGWGFGNGVRVELEGNYRHNDYRTNSGAAVIASGREQKYGAMANALFDLDIGIPYLFPYIGAGVGYASVDQRGSVLGGARYDSSKGDFAYQAIAGVSLPVPGLVGLSVTGEYRYYAVSGNRRYSVGAPAFGAIKTKADYNHDLMLGLRYAFNVAPPPAPAVAQAAAPAPAPARTFLVFFDWDRADLTDRARQVVAEAARSTTQVQVTRIEVNGYTDLSGGAAYNERLSMRRAQTVANELVRLGVPRQAIAVQGFGKTRPLVPTADGVREPQNRRVEIILR